MNQSDPPDEYTQGRANLTLVRERLQYRATRPTDPLPISPLLHSSSLSST